MDMDIKSKAGAECANYVRVDEDDLDGIVRVYDSEGHGYREFSGAPKRVLRAEAEAFAAKVASELGIEWGCNYND